MTIDFGRESAETNRLLALSDGVIAIVITLLVLEITVPTVPAGSSPSALPGLVLDQWHEFVGFVLSFLVIGQYWILHRRVFIYIEKHGRGIVYLNLCFLLAVALVPYATSLFATYPDRFGVAFLAGMLALTGFSLAVLWLYASRRDLIAEGLTSTIVAIQAARFLASPLVFVGSMIVALAVDPLLAMATWLLLLPVNGVLQSRQLESFERAAEASDPEH
jgi:uncharacterized membrane protein